MQKDYNPNVLSEIKDHHSDLQKCVDLLYLLQRKVGPIVEVITILKYDKPLLYGLLKRRVITNPGLKMAFEITVDYEQAKKTVYGDSIS
jgi:hypothetical protein